MAQTVHLWLIIDGTDIEGESTISSLERDGSIECLSFHYGVEIPYDVETGEVTTKRQHGPVTVYKRIDKSTPLLLKALCRHETVNSAEFRFYRPDTTGGGAEEHFYTVLLSNGYIASVEQLSEDAIIGGENAPPMIEEVSFVFQEISWTYESNGATHRDSRTRRT